MIRKLFSTIIIFALVLQIAMVSGTQAAFFGQPVSVNVMNEDVRSVLTLLARSSGVNIVVNDKVSGNITLSLNNIPLDSALDIIGATMNLLIQFQGNVVLVAPADDSGRQNIGGVHVFKLKNAKVEDIVDAVGLLLGEKPLLADPNKKFKDSDMSSSSSSSSGGSTGFSVSSSKIMPPTMNVAYSKLRVDIPTNSIIFVGTSMEAYRVQQLLEQLDVKPKQVLVEAKIVQISKTNAEKYGIDWGNSDGTLVDGSWTNTNTGDTWTLAATAKLNAMISNGDGEVLAQPRVTTINGQPALIHVGQSIPIISSATAATSTSGPTTNYEYVDAGVILTYIPRVASDNSITAMLRTEVSRPVWNDKVNNWGFDIRTADTELRTKDGQSAVIGGLIDRQVINSTLAIPLLSQIPLIGKMFFTLTSNSTEENEVLITITAKVVE